MTPGELFYWPDHKFDDGGTSDKLLIVLNGQRNGCHLVAYTTSNPGRHPSVRTEGCSAEAEVYFIKQNAYGFKKATWVQLFRVKEYDVEYLERLVVKGRLKSLRTLNDGLLRAIVNCYRRTQSFSEYHGWLLGDG